MRLGREWRVEEQEERRRRDSTAESGACPSFRLLPADTLNSVLLLLRSSPLSLHRLSQLASFSFVITRPLLSTQFALVLPCRPSLYTPTLPRPLFSFFAPPERCVVRSSAGLLSADLMHWVLSIHLQPCASA